MIKNLFQKPDKDFQEIMDKFPELLEDIWPLKKKHREELPFAIKNLSEKLTDKRSMLEKNYWSRSENVSAYLYYYLPWNIIRLSTIISNLPIPDPTLSSKYPLLLDAGSGPLTFPITLWISKKNWRKLPIHVFALDKIVRPLELGKRLFYRLAAKSGSSAWKIKYETGSLPMLYEKASGSYPQKEVYPFLISSINVLNENTFLNKQKRYNSKIDSDYREKNNQFYNIFSSWKPLYEANPVYLFFMEPGTRLGGGTVTHLKNTASDFGLTAIFPCVSEESCPLLPNNDQDLYLKRWCHFSFKSEFAPAWLRNLSIEAGLEKKTVSLSTILFVNETAKNHDNDNIGRIISNNFIIEGKNGHFCYACANKGLVLINNNENHGSGDLVHLVNFKKIEKDKKSGAIIMEPASSPINSKN